MNALPTTPISILSSIQIRGFLRGLRQPSITLRIACAEVMPSQASALHQALCASTGSEGPAAITGEDPRDALVLTVLDWCLHIQRDCAIPVFGNAIKFDPRQRLADRPLRFVLPCTSLAAFERTLEWVLIQLRRQIDMTATDDDYRQLTESLSRLAPPGINAMHFARAAYDLGIEQRQLPQNIVALGTGCRTRWLRSSTTDATSLLGTRVASSKSDTVGLLQLSGLPVPVHQITTTIGEAVAAAQRIGFPVVVKPDDQEQGRGVSAGLRDPEQVRRAWIEARRLSGKILVEKHHFGEDIRVTVAHGEVVKIMLRSVGGVTGDGVRTIGELVEAEQATPRMQRIFRQKRKHLLDLDDEALSLLEEQTLSGDSVPALGRFIALRRKNNVSAGGMQSLLDPADLHPDTLAVAIAAAAALRLDIAGIDLICPDPSLSWRETGAVITEVNARPQIGISLAPETYQQVLRQITGPDPCIPVGLVIGDAMPAKRIPALFDGIPALRNPSHIASREGILHGAQPVQGRFANGWDACVAALLNPQVTALVCAISANELLRHGLPTGRIRSAVLLEANGVAAPNDPLLVHMIREHCDRISRSVPPPATERLT